LSADRQNITDDRLDRMQAILLSHSEMFTDVHATLHQLSELQKEQARVVLTLTDTVSKLAGTTGTLTGTVDTLTGTVDTLAGFVDTLSRKVDALVEALLRGGHNGNG